MVEEISKIHWSKEVRLDLKDIYGYIKQNSREVAEKVKEEIFSSSNKLKENPKMYESDHYKIDNDGNYRAYHVYNYRISYRIKEDVIRILRVIHCSREPREY